MNIYHGPFYFIVMLLCCLSCGQDDCEVSPVEDPIRNLSITGRVLNVYDQEGIADVRLSLLDQFGGSYIISWDSLQYSKEEGCFKYEMERDLDFLMDLQAMDPSIRFDQINQSLRPIDDRYYFLYSKQGSQIINSFTRWKYNSEEAVEMNVAPATRIDFVNNSFSIPNIAFQWSFTDVALSKYHDINTSFRIDSENKWRIPSEREVLITIVDDQRNVLYDTTFVAVSNITSVVTF